MKVVFIGNELAFSRTQTAINAISIMQNEIADEQIKERGITINESLPFVDTMPMFTSLLKKSGKELRRERRKANRKK